MDFDEEGDDITLLLFVASGMTNVQIILPISRGQIVWIKPWLQRKSAKNVYHKIVLEVKLTNRCDYR